MSNSRHYEMNLIRRNTIESTIILRELECLKVEGSFLIINYYLMHFKDKIHLELG